MTTKRQRRQRVPHDIRARGPVNEQRVVDELIERTLHRRAVEAAIWGMPIVNYDLMLQEMLTKTPGKVNQVIYWGKPLDWKNQTLTPNPDTLYFVGLLIAFNDARHALALAARQAP